MCRRTSGRVILGGIAACALIVLAGCGGGGDSTTSSTTADSLTKAKFLAAGDAICTDAQQQFADAQRSPPTTPASAAAFTQQLITITEDELGRLSDLSAPAAVQSNLDLYLKAVEQNIAVLKEGLKAAQNGDATGYAAAQAKSVKGQVKRLQLAQAVGFKECSRPAGTAPTG